MLSSCASTIETKTVTVPKTQYVIFTPEKLATPVKPKFYRFDATQSIASATNFKKLQQNFVLLKNYSNQLRTIIDTYEQQIDDLNQRKQELETNPK